MSNIRATVLAALAAMVLSACGGGGSSAPISPPTTTPVAVPATITVTPAAKAETGEPTKFSSSAASITGLQHKWDFGDGATSTEAAPSHRYAKAGDYDVVLTVSDSAGASREVRSTVSVRAMANVAGLLCSGGNQSGWCWQQPRPSGNESKHLVFVTPTTGWRVGEAGEILKTTDGGQSWVRQTSGTQADLHEALFVDDKNGAVLGNGALLTTRDGGTTWTPGRSPMVILSAGWGARMLPDTTLYLPDVYMAHHSADGGTTWTTLPKASALSETGMFWHTDETTRQVRRSTDGGRTLTPVYDFNAEAAVHGFVSLTTRMAASGDRTAVLFTRVAWEATAWFGSFTDYKDVFHRTVDGGATWIRLEATAAQLSVTHLAAISPDGMRLLACYGDSLPCRSPLLSEDGGRTWAPVTPSAQASSIAFVALANPGPTLIAQDGINYWLSEDFGKTWTVMTAPFAGYVESLTRVGSGMLIASQGSAYSSMVSVDKGRSWRQLVLAPDGVPYGAPAPTRYSSDVAFLDAKTGLLLDSTGKLLATNDGGQTWTVRRSDLPLGGGSLHAVDAQTVVFRDKDGRLLRSSDRGLTWLADTSTARYSKIELGKSGSGWGLDITGNLVATQDGGQAWTRVTRPVMDVFNDLHQLDASSWVAVGHNATWVDGKRWHREAIAYTRDGGKSWTAATADASVTYAKDNNTGTSVGLAVYGVTASDAKTIWAVDAGGRILRSDDAGAQWTLAQQGEPGSYYLENIAFFDAQRGWAVGSRGALMATTDGGKTWTRQDSNYNKWLTRIHIADSKTVWVSTGGSVLLATATGGAP
jgi:photosystem II stability/assembly factor-like uncharacterized protein